VVLLDVENESITNSSPDVGMKSETAVAFSDQSISRLDKESDSNSKAISVEDLAFDALFIWIGYG